MHEKPRAGHGDFGTQPQRVPPGADLRVDGLDELPDLLVRLVRSSP